MPDYKYQITAVLKDGKETLPGLSGNAKRGITCTATYPVVCTEVAHGFEEGDAVFASNFTEAAYLNGRLFIVASVNVNDFTLAGVDGTSEVAETTGGELRRAFLKVESEEKVTSLHRLKLSWDAVRGALYYRVYRFYNGAYLRLADTTELLYEDTGKIPSNFLLPPNVSDVALEGNPATATYYQQRRIFAGGEEEPDSWAASEVNDQDTFVYGGDIRASSPFKVTLASAEAVGIRHLVPGRDLVILTGSNEWIVSPGAEGFSITSITQRPQSEIGSSMIRPLYSHGRVIFERRNGGGLYELQYSYDSDGYNARELTLFAQHLFRGKKIKGMAQAFSPNNRVVAVMDDGTANVLAYYPQQEVLAWSFWELEGLRDEFEDVVSVPNAATGEDELYFIISRNLTVGGQEYTTRTIERLHSRDFVDENDAFFVDSGLSFDLSVPARSFGGFYHLRGKEVVALADGGVRWTKENEATPLTVDENGFVDLGVGGEASKVHIGLPYETEIETLSIETPGQESVQSKPKKLTSVTLKIYKSRGYKIGLKDGVLTEQEAQVSNPVGLFTGSERVNIPAAWSVDTSLTIKQTNPLPLSLLNIVPRMKISSPRRGQ